MCDIKRLWDSRSSSDCVDYILPKESRASKSWQYSSLFKSKYVCALFRLLLIIKSFRYNGATWVT